MKSILAFALVALTTLPAYGQDLKPEDFLLFGAGPQKGLQPGCPCDCPCAQGQPCPCGDACRCENCPGKDRAAYRAAYYRAVREHKHLVVWVGYTCVPCEHELADCVHVRLRGPFGGLSGPAVMVNVLRGGYFFRYDLRDDLSVGRIRTALQPPVVQYPPRFPLVNQFLGAPMGRVGGFGFGGGGCRT